MKKIPNDTRISLRVVEGGREKGTRINFHGTKKYKAATTVDSEFRGTTLENGNWFEQSGGPKNGRFQSLGFPC